MSEFVTYERGPLAKLPKRAFTEKLTFAKDDVVRWCEAPNKNLGAGRGRVRRIAVRDRDGRQINLISDASAEWLFKLLVDAVRAACYNAESDLAARLGPHMKRPDEAKKLLANVFASPGEIRVHATGITVVLDCAANAGERTAIAALLSEITAAKLSPYPAIPPSVR